MTKRKKIKISRYFILISILLLFIAFSSLLIVYDGKFKFLLNFIGQVSSSVGIIFFAGVIISILYNKWSKSLISISGFFFIYILGTSLYTYDSLLKREFESTSSIEKIKDIILAMNTTLSEFSPSTDYASGLNTIQHSLIFHIYHLLIYFFIALIVFSFLGRKLLNRLSVIFLKAEDTNIFWNYSENGFSLAKDIIDSTTKEEAVFILPKSNSDKDSSSDDIFDSINKIGATALYDNYDNINLSKKIYQATKHFFMTEDEDFNVKMAFKLLNFLEKSKQSKGKEISLYIYNQSDSISNLFKNYNADIHLYKHCDLTARQFVKENPILKHKKITNNLDGSFDVLILGLGSTGFEIFSKTLCDAQFLDRDFSITCIEKEYKDSKGIYNSLFKDAKEYGFNLEINPSFNGEDISLVNSENFYNWLEHNSNILKYDRIIVCLGDDELNVETALALSKFRTNYLDKDTHLEKIFVHIKDFNKFRFYEDNENLNKSDKIDLFGKFENINTRAVIVNEDLDELAKLINYAYSNATATLLNKRIINKDGFDKINLEWKSLNTFNKDSSRAISITFDNLILLAGGKANVKRYLSSYTASGEKALEYIARKEHLRWCAFLFLKGVRRLDIKDINTKVKLSINGTLTKHIALVDYDELDNISQIVNEKLSPISRKKENFKASIFRIIEYFPVFIDVLKKKKD